MAFWNYDKQNAESLVRIAAATEAIQREFRVGNKTLSGIRFRLGKPGTPTITFTKEDAMKKIVFETNLAPELDPTTVTRELSIIIGSEPPDVRTSGIDVTKYEGFKALVDTPVHLEQVDIDDVGNRSKPAIADYVVADTFPPQQPGLPGIVATGEVNE